MQTEIIRMIDDFEHGRLSGSARKRKLMWEGPLCPDDLKGGDRSGHKGPSHINTDRKTLMTYRRSGAAPDFENLL